MLLDVPFIDDLPLLSRIVVEGFLDGLHRSPFLGYSSEFASYRPYVPGDNLRHLDWKVWARTDALYIRQFEDDTNLRCHVLLDTSASMDFGEGTGNKFRSGRILAAVLAQLMVRQRDAPGLVLFGSDARMALPARASREAAMEVLSLLSGATAEGGTRMGWELDGLVQAFVRRGLVVLISDFFAGEEEVFRLLRRLQGLNQEVLVFHLLAPEEVDFPVEGDVLMRDSETGEERWVDATAFGPEYRGRLEAFCERVRGECLRAEADYQRLRTDEPIGVALSRYLEKRATL